MAWTREKIAEKIDWEGGLAEALEWGLNEDDMPDGDSLLQERFLEVKSTFKAYKAAGIAFMELLPEQEY